MNIDLRKIPLFIINLEEDTVRKEHIIQEFEKHHLTPTFIPGIKESPALIARAKSHLKSLRFGQKTGGIFAVFEDDITFNDTFRPTFEIPKDTDAFYLGISNYRDFSLPGNGPEYFRVNNELGRVRGMLAAHAVIHISKQYVSHLTEIINLAIGNRKAQDTFRLQSQQFFQIYGLRSPILYQDIKYRGQEAQTKDTLTKFITSGSPDPEFDEKSLYIIALSRRDSAKSYFSLLAKIRAKCHLYMIGPESEIQYWDQFRVEEYQTYSSSKLEYHGDDDITTIIKQVSWGLPEFNNYIWIDPRCQIPETDKSSIIGDQPVTIIGGDLWSAKSILFPKNFNCLKLYKNIKFIENIPTIVNCLVTYRLQTEKVKGKVNWHMIYQLTKNIAIRNHKFISRPVLRIVLTELILSAFYSKKASRITACRNMVNSIYSSDLQIGQELFEDSRLNSNLRHIRGPMVTPKINIL